MMAKRCIVLILVLVLANSALASGSMHAGEQNCPMMGMPDCCATAQSQNTTPEAYAARLCCSLNCTMPGTTIPSGTTKLSPPIVLALHNAIVPLSAYIENTLLLRAGPQPERNQHSPPIYIQHLALLI
ncbi:MAG TPA: hypothetical protein VGC66_17590 [Pyrinomonadaceae bacterium]